MILVKSKRSACHEFYSSGGISVISHRHAVANNPLVQGYNPSKPESYLLYIDANVSLFQNNSLSTNLSHSCLFEFDSVLQMKS